MKFSFGKSTQSVTPSWAKQSTRSDGASSTVFGRSDGGGKHGHSVVRSGKVVYSRTIGGNVVANKKK